MTKARWEKVDATLGAVQALREHAPLIDDAIIARSEALAILRAKRDGYEPAILRRDVEIALWEAGRLEQKDQAPRP